MSTKSFDPTKICCIILGAVALVAVIYLLSRKDTEKFGGVDIDPTYYAPLGYKGCTTNGPTLVLLWNSQHGDQPDASLSWDKVKRELLKHGVQTRVLDSFDNTIYQCDGIEEIKRIQTFLNKEVQIPEIRFYRNGYGSSRASKPYLGPLDYQSIITFTLKQM